MRTAKNLGLWSAALLFAIVVSPSKGWAHTSANCPVSAPAGIVSGETYFGSNCVLSSASDLDTFKFGASAGDTWKVVAGSANVAAGFNICLTLTDPNGHTVASGCSAAPISHSATLISKLTVPGTYTIIVSEGASGTMNYGVSLERISPPPADGTALVLEKTVSSQIAPISAQGAYSFYGTTTGTYELSATMTSGGAPENLCFVVYQPGGTVVTSILCTATPIAFTVQKQYTPSANGTYVVIVYASDNSYTLNYNFGIACVSGVCGQPPPNCSLKDTFTYNAASGILTMNYTLVTPVAATWNGFLTSQNTVQQSWTQSLPITDTAVTIPQTLAVPRSGRVGVLSTLTTPTKGITCSSWTLINTGTP